MIGYLRSALAACLAARVEPSFLIHPLDLLGSDQAPGLSFFPGMALSGSRKRALVVRALDLLGHWFRLLPMGQHAREILAGGRLPVRAPAFA
jgi:hypothetical protein